MVKENVAPPPSAVNSKDGDELSFSGLRQSSLMADSPAQAEACGYEKYLFEGNLV